MRTRTWIGQFQKDYYKAFYEQMLRFPVEQAHTAALYAKRTLEAGFTTVRNVGASECRTSACATPSTRV